MLIPLGTQNPYLLSGLPLKFQGKKYTGEDWETKYKLKCFRRRLNTNLSNGQGYVLLGENGLGKSLLAFWIASYAIDLKYRVRWINAGILSNLTSSIWTARQEQNFGKAEEVRQIWRNLLKSDLLVIDDFNRNFVDRSAPALKTLEHTIKWRLDKNKSTFITSNHSKAEFKTEFGPNIWSWIHEKNKIITVKGEDFRKTQIAI